MIRNEETYTQVLEFRKRGFTYSEIAKICGVSKSTVSNYLAKKKFSKQVTKDNSERAAKENKKRMQLLNSARKTERQTHYKEAVRSAETEYKHYKHAPLFTAGLMLYLSQGDMKDSSRIRLTTQNKDAHRIFITFLKEFLGVEHDQLSFWLLLYAGMEETREMKWWSRQIHLSVTHFGKTQFVTQKSKKKILHHGTGNILANNTVLKKKLLRWIALSLNEL